MKPYYQDDLVTIIHADCREILPELSGISAVVTDPPYNLTQLNIRNSYNPTPGLSSWDAVDEARRQARMGNNKVGFMGKEWDGTGVSFQIDTWRLIFEACLPGAMLLSFGGTRTSHRIACAIEDAGWQIRDTIMWVYSTGFPKSHNLSGAIDKKLGYGDRGHRIAVANRHHPDGTLEPNGELLLPYEAKSPEAKLWEGYGTVLKPAYEPIILAMKPLDGTFANNALKHKVAGLNIDATRIPAPEGLTKGGTTKYGGIFGSGGQVTNPNGNPLGRFPANFILDGSQEVMELFPNTRNGGQNETSHKETWFRQETNPTKHAGDSGSAARFFYCAKASRKERDAGLGDMPESLAGTNVKGYQGDGIHDTKPRVVMARNNHPTVKPLALMTYLCKLVKMPEYNLILDPFCGSGTTLLACKKLGIRGIGIDSNEDYCEISKKRLSLME